MLVLNEDQILLQEAARKTIASRNCVATLRDLRSPGHAAGFGREDWAACAAQGWPGVLVAEEFGGFGFGHVGAGVIAQEIGRGLMTVPFLSSAVLAATALQSGENAKLRADWLPRIAAGAVVAAALDEGSKHAPGAIALTAVRSADGGFELNGAKTLALDAAASEAMLVAARLDDRLALFLIDSARSGIVIRNRLLLDGRRAADVTFAQVAAKAGDLVGGEAAIERALDAGRAAVASELVGMAERCFEMTLDYLKVRRQFGKVIGEFQALKHRAALLHCEIENAASAALAANKALDETPAEVPLAVAIAKAKANEVARLAVDEALQLHGGIGMTDELDIGLYMKRIRVDIELLGDTVFHENRVAALLGY
jgi:alkylation response protein AidB-like acyl-CoA dehydrogenase